MSRCRPGPAPRPHARGYTETWISQRPGLRPRTVDLYTWLLNKHITPYLGAAQLGKLSTAMIRQWRADLLGNGVSVSMAAKAYRLLRAVLMTAAEEDRIIPRNPCRIRGAGDEHPEERPVLTVAQVFELADRVGRRPVGNVRKLKNGAYRLRFQQHGEMRTHPEVFAGRGDAERALWAMGMAGRADSTQNRRFRALVLLATFASLRWGEMSALRRSDLDLEGRRFGSGRPSSSVPRVSWFSGLRSPRRGGAWSASRRRSSPRCEST
ncbi:integrase [Nonomuraea muscovyensis]|uniref:Integrase n=1 Tax=Nonomuraea muscovyensis TaxID=1124761 RepID=A0A7X0C9X2_9ACTN|nr:site-specific integrase [Nonomuraea muscovyensis]MBB6350205.1 integrase [Nonomuraea muscovyensis]